MNAWTNFSASETLNMFRSLEMFLRWKNAVFVTLEIWFSKDKRGPGDLILNFFYLGLENTVIWNGLLLFSKQLPPPQKKNPIDLHWKRELGAGSFF